MTTTSTATDYGTVLTTNLNRLVRQLEEAVEDGTWAVSEAASLHTWVRAELVPWATTMIHHLDPAARAAQPYFAELAALDVQLLWDFAGRSAAELAHQLEVVADKLVRRHLHRPAELTRWSAANSATRQVQTCQHRRHGNKHNPE